MPKLDCPLLLSPVFKPKIWGRKNVAPLFARPENTTGSSSSASAVKSATGKNDLIGEVWITDDQSRFLNGLVAGLTLDEASRKFGSELNGSRWTNARFPLLAKYLYTSDWLSVQVHPDDAYARIHDPGSPGKSEMWYFVH